MATPTYISLFSGAGGGDLASQWLKGWRCVCYVERAPYAVEVLRARIRDGLLNDAPIWDDVSTFDGTAWAGLVDGITAGFPCQPFASGGKQRGPADARNGWPHTMRVIREVSPCWAFLENSPNILKTSRKYKRPPYAQTIIGELSDAGYMCSWGCLSASTLGAAHKRERVWIVAHSGIWGWQEFLCSEPEIISTGDREAIRQNIGSDALDDVWGNLAQLENRLGEPSVFGANDGLPFRLDRLGAIGNGQVPAVARIAWNLLTRNEQ